MTLSELLEDLKGFDPETWDVIVRGIPLKPLGQYFTFDHGEKIAHQYNDAYLPFSQMERDVALGWLQCCIQRACERRGWNFVVCNRIADVSAEKDIYDSEIHDSPAEALLAAYIAAVKEEKL